MSSAPTDSESDLTSQVERRTLSRMRLAAFYLVAFAVLPSLSRAQVPVFAFTREESSIKFHVKASVDLTGTFDKWDASLTFSSREAETGVFDVKIQAASVNTGSG